MYEMLPKELCRLWVTGASHREAEGRGEARRRGTQHRPQRRGVGERGEGATGGRRTMSDVLDSGRSLELSLIHISEPTRPKR